MEYEIPASTIFYDVNVNGRWEQTPFHVALLLLYSFGIVGNILVIKVFQKRYGEPSPYRFLATLLGISDLFSSIAFVVRCFERIVFVFNQVVSFHLYICKVTRYISYTNGLASVFIILALGIDRYRKICAPIHWQMTNSQSKTIGVLTFFFGFIFNSPSIFIIGRQTYVIPEINITATRCGISNEYQIALYPLIFYGLYFVVILVLILSIGVMQYHIIQSLIQHAKFRNQMRKVLDKPDRSNNLGRTPQNFRQDISVRNREIAIALAVITFLMVISFLTLTTFQTYNAYQGFYTPFDQMSLAEDLLNEYIMVDIVAVNGVLNPVVYFVLDLKFRKEVRAMCSLTTENP